MLLEEIRDELKRKGIRLSRRNVERILRALMVSGDFWEVVDISESTVPMASEVVKELLRRNLLFKDDSENLRFTEEGKDLLKELNLVGFERISCPACQGRGIPFYWDLDLYREFLEFARRRPEPVRDYDQGSVTPETTVSRVLFLKDRGDLEGKEILVMGAEDDLTGLAVALTRLPKRVLILDIDERLIKLDNEAFKELGIDNAEAMVFDLREPFPKEWLRSFDVFITDPPETYSAFKAFVGRGIASLKGEGSAGYFGLTLRDSSLFRWRDFQKSLIEDFGVVITDIVKNFNDYQNWGYHQETKASQIAPVKKGPKGIWYRSYWYRVEVLEEGKGFNERISDEVFYLDEEGSTT